ncbi:putative ribonuclease H-like domain-containing protein [Tanacetum coccineum]
MPVETTTSTALVSCDGLGGYVWSDHAKEGPNYALMAYSSLSSDLEISNDSNCLKSCMENVKLLKSQNDQLLRDLEKSSLMVLGYKTDNFENASNSLNKLIECQIVDNCKKGLGYEKYNAVPPPYTGNFMPPTSNLSFTGLDEFGNKPVVENIKSDEEVSKVVRKSDDSPIIEYWVSDSEEENVSQTKTEKKIVKPSIAKIEFVKPKQQEKTARKTVKQVEKNRQNTHNPRGNQRNWNNMMSQKLGISFEMFNKACYVCGSFDHLQVDCNYHQNQFQNQRMVKSVWNNAQRDQGVINSGCSRHMTGNMSYLTVYEEIDGGYVAFGGNPKGGKITGKVPRKNNMYSVDLKNIVPKGGLSCLFAKATSDESKLWHRRLGHLNFKTMNKLVKGNMVRGLPSKIFENAQTCVACQKGKQHKASCKSKTENSISLPLHLLHMDLFGPTFVKSLMKKMYCLVVTDDYSRFTWVFILASKDETSGILKSFITRIENLVDHKIKVIRCDNGTEFKNKEMTQFCEIKGILRQFSVVRTPQKNGVAERRNRTLIESARTMLADSKPFGCPVTILNTIDHLGIFDGKANEGFFIGYSLNSKAFREFNSRTRIVEENSHIRFSEGTPNATGSGPDWLFDIDALTRTMNYEPIVAGTQSNGFAGIKASDNVGQARKETKPVKDYILLPLWTADLPYSQDPKSSHDDGSKPSSDDGKKVDEDPRKDSEFNAISGKTSIELPFDPDMPALEDYSIFNLTRDDENDDHPLDQVIGDWQSTTQTRKMSKNLKEHRIEAIRLFLAYASFKDFVVYQMDVKSAFLYGKIEEEVYVCHPPGIEDPDFPDRVYKVEKALYGLHQAPRAWYETLSTYLLDNGFQSGKIDKTLLIKRHKGDILLVQVYVDDIIFGSTKKELCNAFEKLMHEKFQMSSIGELTFFLGLQVQQKKDGIFISQDMYVEEILKKFGFTEVKTASTPMETQKPLLKDEDGEEVDVHMYRSLIGSLMYLTSSRPDIMFTVCACARYQHLHVVKRFFRYLKSQPKLGLWYPEYSPFDLVAYTDCDYARASLDRKSTIGGCQFLGCRIISWQCKK